MSLPADLSVLAEPPGLRERYRRLVLISHRRHLAALAPDDATLVVSTDWLAWREARAKGLHALHFEFALGEWPAERGEAAGTHLRYGGWVDQGGRDITLFLGVSLGRLFVRDVTVFCNAFERMWHALDRLCARFRPATLELVDIRAEHDLLDGAVKRQIAAEVAERSGATLVERLDAPPAADPGFPERPDGLGHDAAEPALKALARRLYGRAIAALFGLRRLVDRRGAVLLIHNWSSTRPLLECHDSATVVPAVLAGQMPKSPAFLAACFRRGVRMINLAERPFTAAEEARLAEIARHIRALPAAAGLERALAAFLAARLLDSGRLRAAAAELKAQTAAIAQGGIRRVLLGDSTSMSTRIAGEAGRLAGLPVDEQANGMFVTHQRYDTRCGDGAVRPLVSRMLCWGVLNEAWIAAQAPSLPRWRTGYPAMDPLRAPPRPLTRLEHALVLPIYADCDDVAALTGNIFGWLAGVVRTLAGRGCRHIRVKVHGGPQNETYYRDVLAEAGVAAEVIKGGPLAPHLAWADLVVGPANSGALAESLAAGVPYFGVLPSPSIIDPALLPADVLIRSLDELDRRLAGLDAPDVAAARDALCAYSEIPDAARATWRALEQMPVR